MTDRAHPHTTRGGRMRFVGPACVVLALLVCLLLLPAAPAGADVMKKYRTAYKNKLDYYRTQMDDEYDVYTGAKANVEQHINLIRTALADPELQGGVPLLEQAALMGRSQFLEEVSVSRNKVYANIATFKATAVKWFRTTKDKGRFKARMKTLRAGFIQIYAADEDLASALLALGTNADVAAANQDVATSQMTSVTAEALFARGLRLLRALQ